MNSNNIIQYAYYDVNQGLLSADKFYHKLKNKGITLSQIQTFLSNQEGEILHKVIRKPKRYFPIVSFYPNDMIQLDIIDFSNISTTNSNFKYMLAAIDIFTRVAFIVPMKNKATHSICEAMQLIVKKFKPNTVE